jgi:hypothetical protein
MNSIDNQGYSSQTNHNPRHQKDHMSNGTMSNQGSFYSNMGGLAPQGSANYEKV